jgi:hypothetical protein
MTVSTHVRSGLLSRSHLMHACTAGELNKMLKMLKKELEATLAAIKLFTDDERNMPYNKKLHRQNGKRHKEWITKKMEGAWQTTKEAWTEKRHSAIKDLQSKLAYVDGAAQATVEVVRSWGRKLVATVVVGTAALHMCHALYHDLSPSRIPYPTVMHDPYIVVDIVCLIVCCLASCMHTETKPADTLTVDC